MTKKEELKVFFETERERKKKIARYEENNIFFNHLLKNGNEEDVEFAILIKMYNYASHLQEDGYYKKANSVADEIEKDLERLKGQSELYEMYLEGITFLKGVCLGRLRKHKESNKYFKQLVEKNPTNDNFVDWYKSNKKNQIAKIANTIAMVAISIVIVGIILNYLSIPNLNVPIIISAIMWTVWLLAHLVSYVWRKIIDKQKIKL